LNTDFQAALDRIFSGPNGLPVGQQKYFYINVKMGSLDADTLAQTSFTSVPVDWSDYKVWSPTAVNINPRQLVEVEVPSTLVAYHNGKTGTAPDITVTLDPSKLDGFYNGDFDSFFSPNPGADSTLPHDSYDLVRVLTHELLHGLGFGLNLSILNTSPGDTDVWFSHVDDPNNIPVYNLGGGPVALSADGDHLANNKDLMYAHYNGEESISATDLSILQDYGYQDHAPQVSIPSSSVQADHQQSFAASTLFSVQADAFDIVQYAVWDAGTGGGYFLVNGVPQPTNTEVDLSPAQFAQLTYHSGAGTDTLKVAAYDGKFLTGTATNKWSQTFTVAVPADNPPTATGFNRIMGQGQTSIAASSLFTASDPDSDTITQYAFWDNGVGGGHFFVNGIQKSSNTEIDVPAAQLAQTVYQGGSGTDTLWVAAYDGNLWSGSAANKWSAAFTVSPYAPSPDLVVSSLTSSTSSVQQGSRLSFSYVIKNQGSTAAGLDYSSWAVDQKPTTSSGVWDTIGSLGVNATASFTDSISTSSLSVGSHTLWVAADNWNNVNESDETNNWLSVGFTVTQPPLPDLIVNGITPTTTSVQQGSRLSFSYVIKNQGSTAAGLDYSSWAVDQKPTTSSGVWDTIGSLGVNATASFTDSISTSSLSVGSHTLWVAADNWNNVNESDETNNWLSVGFTVTQPPLPDLIVNGITPTTTSVQQGSRLSFSYVIKNQGSTAAGLDYSSWAVDQKPTTSSGVWDTIGSLGVNATASFTDSISTSSLSVGSHTLWVAADNWNNVNESDETNNWLSVGFTVTQPPLPDLIVNGITPTTTSVQQGSRLSFSYVIKNQGSTAAGLDYSSWAVDQKPTTSSGVWDTIGSLGVNATASFTDSISTSSLSVGSHTLWVAADNWNNVNESDETNNWLSVGFTVTQPPLPDLIVNGITPTTTSVQQGGTLSFSYTIKNQGNAAADGSYAGIYLDGQSPANELSGPAGYNSISGMASGGSVTANNSFSTAGLSVGQHTLWIKADYWSDSTGQSGNGNVAESNESNNWNSVSFTVTSTAPSAASVLGIGYNASTSQNYLASINPATGSSTVLNSFVFSSGGWVSSTLTAANSIVYALSSNDSHLYRFDANTGAILSSVAVNAPGTLQALRASGASVLGMGYNSTTSQNYLASIP
jgi:subtilase family serine protease